MNNQIKVLVRHFDRNQIFNYSEDVFEVIE